MNGTNRDPAIDLFRGIAIILMVFFDYSSGISWIPDWLRHAPDVGFTAADLVAPLFIFAIAITFGGSWRRRIAGKGRWAAAVRSIGRYAGIAGIGAVISAGEVWVGQASGGTQWGVLQAIGTAGLIALLFIRFAPAARIATGGIILIVYQILLDRFWLETVLCSSPGGLSGSLSWAGMLLIASGLVELFHGYAAQPGPEDSSGVPGGSGPTSFTDFGQRVGGGDPYALVSIGLLMTTAGVALAFAIPVSKNRVSLSYDILTIGLSTAVYGICLRLTARRRAGKPRSADDGKGAVADTAVAGGIGGRGGAIMRFFLWWGANPLLLYILHLVLLAGFVFSENPLWYVSVHPALALIQFVFLVSVLSGIARSLYRRGRFFIL